ncbi:MAG: adenylate/guanylate cyclase domain-containing protein, partial [Candidatus Limnocylindria bacterium]
MVRARVDRRLATVLFVDIVDSTRIASDVGDRRWRELLGSFRRAVRRQLRSHGGHEQDTAGDGFFATFDRPAASVRAATAIADAAQSLGFDVRCGLHTGELERIDGRLGGIAAHIGARVMALAGPAEVLVTGTVHDLVVGGGISFEPADDAQLKGVPGRWTLYRVTEVDSSSMAMPLGAEEASGRRGVSNGSRSRVLPRPRLV